MREPVVFSNLDLASALKAPGGRKKLWPRAIPRPMRFHSFARVLQAPNRSEDSPSKSLMSKSEPPGDRTQDPRLKRPVLYQLS
jgi:hypothetical protein